MQSLNSATSMSVQWMRSSRWRRSAIVTRLPCLPRLDVEMAGPPVVWSEKHLKVMVRQNGRSLALKAWNFAARAGS